MEVDSRLKGIIAGRRLSLTWTATTEGRELVGYLDGVAKGLGLPAEELRGWITVDSQLRQYEMDEWQHALKAEARRGNEVAKRIVHQGGANTKEERDLASYYQMCNASDSQLFAIQLLRGNALILWPAFLTHTQRDRDVMKGRPAEDWMIFLQGWNYGQWYDDHGRFMPNAGLQTRGLLERALTWRRIAEAD